MTDDEIIALAVAHKLGAIEEDAPGVEALITDYGDIKLAVLEFARALIAAEREACAKVCDDRAADWRKPYWDEPERLYQYESDACSNAIRARRRE